MVTFIADQPKSGMAEVTAIGHLREDNVLKTIVLQVKLNRCQIRGRVELVSFSTILWLASQSEPTNLGRGLQERQPQREQMQRKNCRRFACTRLHFTTIRSLTKLGGSFGTVLWTGADRVALLPCPG